MNGTSDSFILTEICGAVLLGGFLYLMIPILIVVWVCVPKKTSKRCPRCGRCIVKAPEALPALAEVGGTLWITVLFAPMGIIFLLTGMVLQGFTPNVSIAKSLHAWCPACGYALPYGELLQVLSESELKGLAGPSEREIEAHDHERDWL